MKRSSCRKKFIVFKTDKRRRQYHQIFHEQLLNKNGIFVKFMKSLNEMEDLKRFQGFTFDTIARRRSVEDQDTILEFFGRTQELQNEINCMNDAKDFRNVESGRGGHSHVTSQLVFSHLIMKRLQCVCWRIGHNPDYESQHFISNGIRIQCDKENFVPIVAPGLSTSSCSCSLFSTSRTLSRQQRHCSTSSSSSYSSFTVSDTKAREREDRIESDIPPVIVSTTADERSGRPDIGQAEKIQNRRKKSTERTGRHVVEGTGWPVVCRLRSRKHSNPRLFARIQKIRWMIEFLNTETHTPVLLMKFL